MALSLGRSATAEYGPSAEWKLLRVDHLAGSVGVHEGSSEPPFPGNGTEVAMMHWSHCATAS